ncbi:hypothetical protein F2P81_006818 [Scophthalmus maximus]|uniref:Uncharacterized protein n=1 Tax=Scophthalmus maximus TaxID=52904 RepID=A0A6A4TAM6_SCOMX|nr:hypothetical protein F2P81_006818 [Scophthalmus maximus]
MCSLAAAAPLSIMCRITVISPEMANFTHRVLSLIFISWFCLEQKLYHSEYINDNLQVERVKMRRHDSLTTDNTERITDPVSFISSGKREPGGHG